MSADDRETPERAEIEELARRARERAATALLELDIRNLADHAIEQINTLADRAVNNAQQVDVLMQRLADLLEHDDEEP
jgi:hypothetical protein